MKNGIKKYSYYKYRQIHAELVEYHKDGNKFVIDNIEKLSDFVHIHDNNNNIYYRVNGQHPTTFKENDKDKDKMTRSELVEDVIKSMAEANDLVLKDIVKHYNKDDCKYANRLIEEVNKKIRFGRLREEDFFQELYVLNKAVIESNNFRYTPRRKEAEKYLINKDQYVVKIVTFFKNLNGGLEKGNNVLIEFFYLFIKKDFHD